MEAGDLFGLVVSLLVFAVIAVLCLVTAFGLVRWLSRT
jgi:hypothetical protein